MSEKKNDKTCNMRNVFVPDPSLTDLCHFPSRLFGESSILSVDRDPTERLVKLEIETFVSDFLFESLDVFEFVLECLCSSFPLT